MSDGVKKTIVGVLALVLVVWAVVKVAGFFGGEEFVQTANTRTLMDVETRELFEFEFTENWGPYPHKNPKTGKETLYPIEWCFSRECGEAGGTPVILNSQLNKPEPTYCPKCGALVRFHNPKPHTGAGGS